MKLLLLSVLERFSFWILLLVRLDYILPIWALLTALAHEEFLNLSFFFLLLPDIAALLRLLIELLLDDPNRDTLQLSIVLHFASRDKSAPWSLLYCRVFCPTCKLVLLCDRSELAAFFNSCGFIWPIIGTRDLFLVFLRDLRSKFRWYGFRIHLIFTILYKQYLEKIEEISKL